GACGLARRGVQGRRLSLRAPPADRTFRQQARNLKKPAPVLYLAMGAAMVRRCFTMTTDAPASRETLGNAINLRLSLLGCQPVESGRGGAWVDLAAPIFARQREITRRLSDRLSPADDRIQRFLESYLADVGPAPQLLARTFVLDQPGLARALSLPAGGDAFASSLLKSYRL